MLKQELENIITKIDWPGLEEKIAQVINLPVKLVISVKEGVDPFIDFESQELADSAGVMAAAFSTLKIISFSGHFNPDKQIFFTDINFKWELKTGGRNCCDLFRAWFNLKTGEWIFK